MNSRLGLPAAAAAEAAEAERMEAWQRPLLAMLRRGYDETYATDEELDDDEQEYDAEAARRRRLGYPEEDAAAHGRRTAARRKRLRLRVRRGGCSEEDSNSDEASQYHPLRPEGSQARTRGETPRQDRTLRRRGCSDDEDEDEGPQVMPRTLGAIQPPEPARRGPNQHMPPRLPRAPPSRAVMVRCLTLP